MALTGSYGDLYIRQYSDLIEHEMQQNGSVLRSLVTVEPGIMGERRYFPKLGKSTSYEITGRSQAVEPQDSTFERRFVTPRAIESVHRIEMLDAIRYQSSPSAELVSSIAQELGRSMDSIIMAALSGSAGRELDGSSSSASFDSNNTIAVNVNTFSATALVNDTGLHEGKIINMKRRLLTNYSLRPGDELFVIAPAIQLAGLHQRVLQNPGAGFFQKNLPDVNHPMLDAGLDGFLGARYIQYEDTGVDGSSDQYVYMFLRKALKMGIWQDVKFTQTILETLKGDPVQLKANMAIGAVRMWEEGVMRVLCDPTPLYALT
jgi:hypothetical protein